MLSVDSLLCWLLGADAGGAQRCLDGAMSRPAVGAVSECP